MIEMKNCTDVLKYEKYIPENCLAPIILESVDIDKVSGFIIFEYSQNEVTVYAVESFNDTALFDGLVRSAMFKAILSGIEYARFELSDENSRKTAEKLRFIKDDCTTVEIDSILGGCKGCSHSQ